MGYFDFIFKGAQDAAKAARPKPSAPSFKPLTGTGVGGMVGGMGDEVPKPQSAPSVKIDRADVETGSEPKPVNEAARRAKKAKLQVLDDQVTKAREAALKVVRGLGKSRGGYEPGEGGAGYAVAPAYEEAEPTGIPEIDALFDQFKSEAQAGTADVGRLADILEQTATVYEKRGPDIGLNADAAAAQANYLRQQSKNLQAALDARDEAESLRMELKAENAGPSIEAQQGQIEANKKARIDELKRKMADIATPTMDRERMRRELLDLQQSPQVVQPEAHGDTRFSGDAGAVGQGAKSATLQLGIDPMKALKNATGSDDKTLDVLGKTVGGMREYGDWDLDEEDDMMTGQRKMVEKFGPEGMAMYFGKMLQTFGGGPGGGVMQLAGQALQQNAKPKDPLAENQRQQDTQQAIMRQKLAELRDADPMRTTGGVLLFVLMSMLLGPGIATVILSNRAKQGKLADDISMLKLKLKGLEEQRAILARRQEQQIQFRQQEARDDRQFQRQLSRDQIRAAERHREILAKAAELKAQGVKDATLDKLEKQHRMLIAEASETGRMLGAEARTQAILENAAEVFEMWKARAAALGLDDAGTAEKK